MLSSNGRDDADSGVVCTDNTDNDVNNATDDDHFFNFRQRVQDLKRSYFCWLQWMEAHVYQVRNQLLSSVCIWGGVYLGIILVAIFFPVAYFFPQKTMRNFMLV